MNCHKAYSKLLVLSREELNLPTNIDLVQHLHSCPFCDTFRDIWLTVDKDIEKGLSSEDINWINADPVYSCNKCTLEFDNRDLTH